MRSDTVGGEQPQAAVLVLGASARRAAGRRLARAARISSAASATTAKLAAFAARPSCVPPAAVSTPASSGPAVKPL